MNAEASYSLAPAKVRRRYWAVLIAVGLAAAYFASDFYTMNADEHGVVRRFGAIAARVGPGIHYRMP